MITYAVYRKTKGGHWSLHTIWNSVEEARESFVALSRHNVTARLAKREETVMMELVPNEHTNKE